VRHPHIEAFSRILVASSALFGMFTKSPKSPPVADLVTGGPRVSPVLGRRNSSAVRKTVWFIGVVVCGFFLLSACGGDFIRGPAKRLERNRERRPYFGAPYTTVYAP